MREWNMTDINQIISNKKAETDKIILRYRTLERPVRRRSRDEEERHILDRLCLNKWRTAEANGAIKYINKNEWYYEC